MSNTIPSSPTLELLFKLTKKDIFNGMNCHAIGRIESFNTEEQTSKISIAYSRASVNDTTKIAEYPVLVDCPTIVIGGGAGSLRFPIKKGDECLIFFNDKDIDNWFTGGSENAVLNSDRKHSFTDAIALVGIRSLAKILPNYDPDRTELIHEETKVSMKTKISIFNQVADMYDILNRFAGVMENFLSTPAAVGSPVSLSPGQVIEMKAIRVDLGNLMETL